MRTIRGSNRFLPALAVILISGICLLITFREAAISPNSVMLKLDGDGFKNYYTPWYHAKYDSSLNWFGGMNYPYGDHLVFSDAQPLLSNSIWLISSVVDISDYTMGIMHAILLLSWIAAAWFLYRILLELNVPPWFAAVCAILILAMSPQLWRFRGHFALAYVCYIPALWWLIISCLKKPGWKKTAGIVIFCTAFSALQPYYLLIGFLFTGATWLTALFYKRWRKDWKTILPQAAMQVFLPMILFSVFLALTDPVDDRPGYPYGFFAFRASWWSIFVPAYLPHAAWLKMAIKFPVVEWEGVAYVGIPAAICFPLFFIRGGLRWIKTRFRKFPRFTIHHWLTITVIAGILTMLFSQRYPLVGPLKVLTEWFPPINQFRSIGRFAWIFYYIWTVFSAYGIYRLYRLFSIHRKWRVAGITLVFLAAGIMTAEGITWHRFIRRGGENMHRNRFLGDEKNLLPENQWMNEHDPGKYCAILAIPFFHVGSENFSIVSDSVPGPAFAASLRTGLPLVNSMMSRTSFGQTWEMIRLVTEPFDDPGLRSLMSEKALLLIHYKNFPARHGLELIEKGELIYENEAIGLYELGRDDLETGKEALVRKLLTELSASDTLYRHRSGYLLTRPDASFYSMSFDDEANDFAFKGMGGKQERGWDYNFLLEGPLNSAKSGNTVFSVWVFLKEDMRPLTELGLEQFGSDSLIKFHKYETGGTLCRMLHGSWGLVESEMPVGDPENQVIAILRRDSKKPAVVRYDEFMIRAKETHAWKIQDGFIGKDNRWFPIGELKIELPTEILNLDSTIAAQQK